MSRIARRVALVARLAGSVRARCLLAALLACAAVLAACPAAAQLDSSNIGCDGCLWRPNPAGGGRWTLRIVPLDGDEAVSAAQARAMHAVLAELSEVVHAAPPAARPVSVNYLTRAVVDRSCTSVARKCQWKQVSGRLLVQLEPRLVNAVTGDTMILRDNQPSVILSVNDPGDMYLFGTKRLAGGGTFDEDGHEMLLVQQKLSGIDGYTLYDDQYVVLTRNPRPLWIPVSRERYLRGLIKGFRDLIAADPVNKPSSDMMIGLINRELAAMGAAERRSQAHLGSDGVGSLSRLVAEDAAGATPVFIFNPAYFDPALPVTTPQLIVVRFDLLLGQPDEPPDKPDTSLLVKRPYEIEHTLDYRRLEAILRRGAGPP